MNDTRSLILDTAERICRDQCTKDTLEAAESGEWSPSLWSALEDSGLTLAGIPEETGGSGGDLGDAMGVLSISARHAAPVPLAETFITAWALARMQIPIPSGPLTAAICPADILGTDEIAYDVPWARAAGNILWISNGRAALVPLDGLRLQRCANLAGEPRDRLTLLQERATEEAWKPLPEDCGEREILHLGALCRAVQIAAASETILRLTVEHANLRVQFGRPIGTFQAIRQQLAVMAGEVAAASVAADWAVRAVQTKGVEAIEVDIAKTRAGEAVGTIAAIAHQVHGAMGITHEHVLHHFTRRLWSWRDEFGPERDWQISLGRQAASTGADKLWRFLTQT